eukprot:SAG22_NODE_7027_length_784_cov_1.491971_1_plen_78_part_00
MAAAAVVERLAVGTGGGADAALTANELPEWSEGGVLQLLQGLLAAKPALPIGAAHNGVLQVSTVLVCDCTPLYYTAA